MLDSRREDLRPRRCLAPSRWAPVALGGVVAVGGTVVPALAPPAGAGVPGEGVAAAGAVLVDADAPGTVDPGATVPGCAPLGAVGEVAVEPVAVDAVPCTRSLAGTDTDGNPSLDSVRDEVLVLAAPAPAGQSAVPITAAVASSRAARTATEPRTGRVWPPCKKASALMLRPC